ncbi:hypothetical protein [Hymenobacter sp. HDW8]|uniref:hypothetical protein n=1 Tax=Hymenobacter sp. HDW8 TaxID=2714932 RepID=UPI00140B65D8|nr:hypothetical protein [Hymenobacter sp. HDW8]QIL74542.1 hypothetical protein G7064_00700 [Hymenobacter sp. HDW8]
MEYLVYLFPVFFISIWVFVTYIISKFGWSDLVSHYKANDNFVGKRIGLISASINRTNYNNSLLLEYNSEGIYLKPIFLFRLFHDPILIPWKDIKEVRDKKFIFFDFKELIIGDPPVAVIKLNEKTFTKMEKDILSINSK